MVCSKCGSQVEWVEHELFYCEECGEYVEAESDWKSELADREYDVFKENEVIARGLTS